MANWLDEFNLRSSRFQGRVLRAASADAALAGAARTAGEPSFAHAVSRIADRGCFDLVFHSDLVGAGGLWHARLPRPGRV